MITVSLPAVHTLVLYRSAAVQAPVTCVHGMQLCALGERRFNQFLAQPSIFTEPLKLGLESTHTVQAFGVQTPAPCSARHPSMTK